MGANSLDPGIKGSQLGNAARIQVPHGLKFRYIYGLPSMPSVEYFRYSSEKRCCRLEGHAACEGIGHANRQACVFRISSCTYSLTYNLIAVVGPEHHLRPD